MAAAEPKPQDDLLEEFKHQEHFVKCLLDAWALVSPDGRVVKSNLLFSQLIGESSRKILKADSFDQLLTLRINEDELNIDKILSYENPTRIDEVTGETVKGREVTLIIGVYPYFNPDHSKFLGSFLLVRDVTDDKNLHDKYKTTKTDSITDQLTGLYTRRHFESYLQNQQIQAQNDNDPIRMAVIMVDIDHFKKVNDVHGHQAGDEILKGVGSLIANNFRKTDVPCRYGGEEFIILLPGTSLQGAARAAENLRKIIEEHKVIFEEKHIPVTISLGVGVFQFLEESYSDTIKKADLALYAAKEEGRNQVQVHHKGSTLAYKDYYKK